MTGNSRDGSIWLGSERVSGDFKMVDEVLVDKTVGQEECVGWERLERVGVGTILQAELLQWLDPWLEIQGMALYGWRVKECVVVLGDGGGGCGRDDSW